MLSTLVIVGALIDEDKTGFQIFENLFYFF